MIDCATGLVGGDKVKKIKKTEEIDTWLTEVRPSPLLTFFTSDGTLN